MKYCTWKENGKSFIFEDGYIINPYNGDMQYMGEYIFNHGSKVFKDFMTIQEFLVWNTQSKK